MIQSFLPPAVLSTLLPTPFLCFWIAPYGSHLEGQTTSRPDSGIDISTKPSLPQSYPWAHKAGFCFFHESLSSWNKKLGLPHLNTSFNGEYFVWAFCVNMHEGYWLVIFLCSSILLSIGISIKLDLKLLMSSQFFYFQCSQNLNFPLSLIIL